MQARSNNQPRFIRPGLLPAALGAMALLAGMALIGSEWFTFIRYSASVLALIIAVIAVQGRQWWWIPLLVAIAVVWNPVWPLELEDQAWRLAHVLGSALFIVVGAFLRTPESTTARGA